MAEKDEKDRGVNREDGKDDSGVWHGGRRFVGKTPHHR
jgi:hypothetical protein